MLRKIEQENKLEKNPAPRVMFGIERGFHNFIPPEFGQDPIGYFEQHGNNIKPGEVQIDETGRVHEDPTAVKEMPVWTDNLGNELKTVGKRVNVKKGEIGKSGDPFYEYEIMKIVDEVGLPVIKPVAKVEDQNTHLIIMEKGQGIGWFKKEELELKEKGYTNKDIQRLKTQAMKGMSKLKREFNRAGIVRKWKLQDMIFDLDVENKKIIKITPTDWERTKIDQEKLERYKKKLKNV